MARCSNLLPFNSQTGRLFGVMSRRSGKSDTTAGRGGSQKCREDAPNARPIVTVLIELIRARDEVSGRTCPSVQFLCDRCRTVLGVSLDPDWQAQIVIGQLRRVGQTRRKRNLIAPSRFPVRAEEDFVLARGGATTAPSFMPRDETCLRNRGRSEASPQNFAM